MSSSPTLNQLVLTDGPLWNTFQRWEASVSSQEKITLMEELISMFSVTSDGSLEVEKLMYSMWVIITQTLNLLEEHQRRDTTMRSRMAMLSAEASADQQPAELEIARLILNGLRLRVLRLENSFGNTFTTWIQRVQLALSRNCQNIATGNTLYMLPNIGRQPELNSLMEILMDDMIGYSSLAWEVDHHE